MHRKWGAVVYVFLRCVEREHASYQMMPFEGAVMDQPVRTMEAFDLLQGVLSEEITKAVKRGKK